VLFPSLASALTITTVDDGVNITIDDSTFDLSANCSNKLTGFADGDGFCTQSGCVGNPPYDISGHMDTYATAGSDTFCIYTPTTGAVQCKMDATGSDGAWVLDAGSTMSGTCNFVGWSSPLTLFLVLLGFWLRHQHPQSLVCKLILQPFFYSYIRFIKFPLSSTSNTLINCPVVSSSYKTNRAGWLCWF